jgi:ABC-type multidrug transport system fused ATPase/permease subunit
LTAGNIYTPRPSPFSNQDYPLDQINWVIPFAKAFVAQIPWIENASVKTNILFGLPFKQDRYLKVLQVCALTDDLKMLPDGEETEIGASGINLSGGQRWRVTCARALYSRAGILVLDDIFSAVDAHVGRHILEQALLGELGIGRTRILVTHHIGLVRPWATYVVELDGGKVQSTVTQEPSSVEPSRYSAISKASSSLNGGSPLNDPSNSSPDALGPSTQPAKQFVEEEKREAGRVKWTIYKTYAQASGGFFYWAFTLGVFFLSAFTGLGRSYWLRIWTRYYDDNSSESSLPPISSQELSSESAHGPDNHLIYYLTIYTSISLFAAFLICVKVAFVFVAALRASRKLFEDLTYKVLRAPLRWLDTVPVGRILNRFVGDFILVDTRLGGDFQWFFTWFLSVITIIISALFISFMMVIPITFLVVFSLYYTTIYLDGARDLKRLESSSKSPIFELVGSMLSGLATVRSFDKVDDYLNRMYDCIDEYGRCTWNLLLVSRWMSFRQGLLGACFTLCVAASVILLRGIDASLAGFAISFALEYSSVAVELVTRYTNFELDMNSAERIAEYTEMATEDQSGNSVPASWPSKGEIIMEDLEVSYAPDLPLVLKGLTFEIKPCQRVGVVGRTGSGKSTLTLSIFRFLEARSGRIMIDGLDISQFKLHDLRSRLAIIPQDPVLFSGTIRSNLDPFDEQSDATVFDALRRVYLLDSEATPRENRNAGYSQASGSNTNIFHNLSHPISRGGLNLSQGQRQLLCLARAIVKQPKIIILDEATSSIDMGTDALIQRSIREQFRGSTLVVIAHRLSTIADFDRVVVMSEGMVEEFDSPRNLMAKKGAFWSLVGESGEKEMLEERIG